MSKFLKSAALAAAVTLCAGPFHPGIRRTFAEMDVVFTREAFKIGVGKDQRCIHQSVDHQTVVFLPEINRTRVVTLKRTALRRDRAVQRMNRCEVD